MLGFTKDVSRDCRELKSWYMLCLGLGHDVWKASEKKKLSQRELFGWVVSERMLANPVIQVFSFSGLIINVVEYNPLVMVSVFLGVGYYYL